MAQRSAGAAREIKTLISASADQVKTGVRLVGETGQVLTAIATQVEEVNDAVTAIAASAVDQSNGLAEVNRAVNQMDQVTQQNAAMVEQSTAASHNLAQETAELVRMAERFRTGDRVEAAPGTAASHAAPPDGDRDQTGGSCREAAGRPACDTGGELAGVLGRQVSRSEAEPVTRLWAGSAPPRAHTARRQTGSLRR